MDFRFRGNDGSYVIPLKVRHTRESGYPGL